MTRFIRAGRGGTDDGSVVPLIIGLNVGIFFLWNFSGAFSGFMARSFVVSWDALTEGRLWVLPTAVFSHYMFFHLLLNMLVLLSFGPALESILGRNRFIGFYLIAGLISSLAHAFVSNFIMGDPSQGALGASGAVAGVILMFSLFYPRERILIFGLIPVPAMWGALAFIGLDLWGLVAQAGGGGLPIGHGAHLGGAFTGIIYYLLMKNDRAPRNWKSAWAA